MWIARDKDGVLCIYGMKPYKDEKGGQWLTCDSWSANNFVMQLPDCDLYQEVQWSDDEPTELTLKRR